MRVLHLVKTSTGASWALRQMRELVSMGVQVHVALPPGGPLVPDYRAAGIIVHLVQADMPLREPWRLGRVVSEFRDLVSHVDPDIIHSHFVGTTLTMRLALGNRSRIPRVFQVPGPLHLEHALFRRAELWIAGAPDYWIGSCKWTRERYRISGVPRDRVFLSYYGVNLESYAHPQSGRLRGEIGVGPGAKLVGTVAFMYPPKRYLGQRRGIKGHEDLIDAIELCRRAEPGIMGVMIGGAWNGASWYERQIRSYAHRRCRGGIVFLGTRADVVDLYPDLDVAVHPSHSENVGGAVESLLLRRPTIATDVGGFPDLVKHGTTGWLVPPRAPGQLAEAILAVLRNPVHSFEVADRGHALASKLFDVRRTATEVLQIYRIIA